MCAVPFNDLHKDKLKLKDLQKIQRLVKERIPTGAAVINFLIPLSGVHLKVTDMCNHFLHRIHSVRQKHIQYFC